MPSFGNEGVQYDPVHTVIGSIEEVVSRYFHAHLDQNWMFTGIVPSADGTLKNDLPKTQVVKPRPVRRA